MDLFPMLFGLDFMDPQWLLAEFGAVFFWVCLLIIFVECGLFFPFLPGDALLFALGIFIATGEIDVFPGSGPVAMGLALLCLTAAAWTGNVIGYEIGRGLGTRIGHRDGRIVKRKHLDKTQAFFDEHGKKALVIGRFLAFVRTYVTVVAGITQMERRTFYAWSLIGGVLWTFSITLVGYFLGDNIPWLEHNIDLAIMAILAFTAVPILWEWHHNRRKRLRAAAEEQRTSGPPPSEVTPDAVS